MRPDQARTLNEVFDDENIGAAISKIRRLRIRESQARFAEKLGLTREQLANIETGRTSISATIAWDFCRRFDVHPDWVMNGGGPQEEPEKFSTIPSSDLLSLESILTDHREMKFRQFWKLLRQGNRNQKKVLLDISPAFSQNAAVNKQYRSLPELLADVRRLTKARGKKVELAQFAHVTRQAVDQWLSGSAKPSAETTFALLNWVRKQSGNQT